jgi:hypothetical protein
MNPNNIIGLYIDKKQNKYYDDFSCKINEYSPIPTFPINYNLKGGDKTIKNKRYIVKLNTKHIDKNNIGPSCVVAFGDYTGGELVVENLPHNIRHRPFIFNASCTPHSVSPVLSGTRFSIVFFRQRFPAKFYEKYGHNLMYDDILSLIPPRLDGQPASAVRIP